MEVEGGASRSDWLHICPFSGHDSRRQWRRGRKHHAHRSFPGALHDHSNGHHVFRKSPDCCQQSTAILVPTSR